HLPLGDGHLLPGTEASKAETQPVHRGKSVSTGVCMSAHMCEHMWVWGVNTANQRGCPDFSNPPVLTSRKQSCSSENSGRLLLTVVMISSRVSTGFAQRVCVNFLNSGWDRREAGCLVTPRKEGRLSADTLT
ncbi:mCG146209, partial [Mus musculus]